jgi:hypothetical protein
MPPSTDAPLVSLVVPCFASTPHALALLDETLATVDAQSVAEREVLVVDDGSPRDVAAVVARHPHARTLRRRTAARRWPATRRSPRREAGCSSSSTPTTTCSRTPSSAGWPSSRRTRRAASSSARARR